MDRLNGLLYAFKGLMFKEKGGKKKGREEKKGRKGEKDKEGKRGRKGYWPRALQNLDVLL